MPTSRILLFSGQGLTAANDPALLGRVQEWATTRWGALLLSECVSAFLKELQQLSEEEHAQLGFDLTLDLRTILLTPLDKPIANHPLLSGCRLHLLQSLCILSYLEQNDDFFAEDRTVSDILAYSSGILPACALAASRSVSSFIAHSVEVFRLAFWIGFRAHLYRMGVSGSTWALVVLGLTVNEVSNILKKRQYATLSISSIIDHRFVAISGRPDELEALNGELAARGDCTLNVTELMTIYHSHVHVGGIRDDIFSDIDRRRICFPRREELCIPVRSTFTGRSLKTLAKSQHLVTEIVDMLIIYPVNWAHVMDLAAQDVASKIPTLGSDEVHHVMKIELINFGPGTGVVRGVRKYLSRIQGCDATIVDASGASARPTPGHSTQIPIAITGMAVNMPGAPTAAALWGILENGLNMASKIPELRFAIEAYSADSGIQGNTRSLRTQTGNFIANPDAFDAAFFEISPREARLMDPQQRVLLLTAHHALESAGYVPVVDSKPVDNPTTSASLDFDENRSSGLASFNRESIGCYIGVSTNDYVQNLRNNFDIFYSTGTLQAFLSGRISYHYQWSGPSVVVDTSCSSSMVAIYQACRAISNGDCTAALAGGVNIITSPDMYIGLERAHLLTSEGQCKVFDVAADGYSRGEGCGLFVLKSLEAALAERDTVLGVIRSIEVNQSGNANSITRPHAETQARLFQRVLDCAGVAPSAVTVIEAHGTGTQAGDPAEIKSIQRIFSGDNGGELPLHVTSLKANIGHLEAASGAAGLAKLLLMMQHHMVPAQISLQRLNPNIVDLAESRIVIDRTAVPWVVPEGHKRIAVLNNFGIAGSNAALLLEEFAGQAFASNVDVPANSTSFVVGLSAKTVSALEVLRKKYIVWLTGSDSRHLDFGNIAYTMTARRQLYTYRLAVAANSRHDLANKLKATIPSAIPASGGTVVFVFSGQGGQYLGMGRSLYETSSCFRLHIDRSDALLKAAGFAGIIPIITGHGVCMKADQLAEAFQVAIFALQYSMTRLFASWGIVPSAVIGHSLGEYAALVVANVLSFEEALLLVARRSRLMTLHCEPDSSGMIAVKLPQDQIQNIINTNGNMQDLAVACFNGASGVVIAGPRSQLGNLQDYLQRHSVACTTLNVPFGYHSNAMRPIYEELLALSVNVTLKPPTIFFASNVLGRVVHPGEETVIDNSYFARHCLEPVRFQDALRALTYVVDVCKPHVWIDLGPHSTTIPILKSNLLDQSFCSLMPTLRRDQHVWDTISTLLARLYQTGIYVRWEAVFDHVPMVRNVYDVPGYPFDDTKYWVPFREDVPSAVPMRVSRPAQYSTIRACIQIPSAALDRPAVLETPLADISDLVHGHKVGDWPLCPASFYVAQLLSGISLVGPGDRLHAVIRHMRFSHPLVDDAKSERCVVTHVALKQTSGTFKISSRIATDADNIVHVCGEFDIQDSKQTFAEFASSMPLLENQISQVLECADKEVLSRMTIYNVIFPRVVQYSLDYHVIDSLIVSSSRKAAVASVSMTASMANRRARRPHQTFLVDPIFIDCLFHVAGFLANLQAESQFVYICSEVGQVHIAPELVGGIDSPAETDCYRVLTTLSPVQDGAIVLADSYAVRMSSSPVLVAKLKGIAFQRLRLDTFQMGLGLAGNSGAEDDVDSTSGSDSLLACPASSALIAEALGMDVAKLTDDVDIHALGLDSLTSIEIRQLFKERYSCVLPPDFFSAQRTIRSVDSWLQAHHEPWPTTGSTKESSTAMLPVKIHDTAKPGKDTLVLVHDGSGMIDHYYALHNMDRTLWAIPNPRIFSGQPWTSLSGMATSYAGFVTDKVPEPVILGGWSFGGAVAYEMACILIERGYKVHGVVLIDSPSPSHRVPLSDSVISHALGLDKRRSTYTRRNSILPVLGHQFRSNGALLGRYESEIKAAARPAHTRPIIAFLRCQESYQPSGVSDVPAWLTDRKSEDGLDGLVSGWETFTRSSIRVWNIPGHHFEPFHPTNVDAVSKALAEACDFLQKSN
ncbi:ketoacyl-synt-domain-containing protein [Fistulina hepatica ATCC 64428]|uniref:Ketoacyl-synt-domain-containing protein n=1 Tax=Fistulina hepatica ATCC 64428 TaxID=1128425 RepID=A0A0D7A8Y2_9AGAR|nr:ketoacyl-synt-domain-containing protein [Fistulina hepatica ATCC 64428]